MKYKLADICKVINGRAYKQNELLEAGKYPVLRVGNFFSSDRWYYSNLELSSEKYCKNGDLLYAWSASFGPKIWTGEKVIYHYHIWKLLPDEAKVDKYYLYYWLLFSAQVLTAGTHGSVMAHITKREMENQTIDLPDKKTQEKISLILRRLDDKIELNNKINNHLEQLACTIFSDIMVHTSAPLCSLKQLANINPSRKLPKGSCARYIDMSRLSTTGCFPSGWEYRAYNGGMRFTNGDTLLARITPCLENGKTAYVNFLDDQEVAFGSTEYVVISPKDPYPPELFYCLARYPAFVDYAVKNINGSSGRQRVSAETIGNYKMPALTTDELIVFYETVPSMFQSIRDRAIENISLTELRDTLLPRLMSGELDVSDLDI